MFCNANNGFVMRHGYNDEILLHYLDCFDYLFDFKL